jgi:glycosyltransferase involved in cell wall biosynthesis
MPKNQRFNLSCDPFNCQFLVEYKITLVHFFFNEVPEALPLALLIRPFGANVIEFVHCDKLAKNFIFITILGRFSLEKLVHRVIEVNKSAPLVRY